MIKKSVSFISGLFRPARKAVGFSLVEVMVVMTIAAVAAALLFPALKAVKNRANSVECALRLRSWGISFGMYAADHNGFYPFGWKNDKYNYMSDMVSYVEPSWLKDSRWSLKDGTIVGGGVNRRIDPKKSGCPTAQRAWDQDKIAPGFAYKIEPLPFAYNTFRFDYAYWTNTLVVPFANVINDMSQNQTGAALACINNSQWRYTSPYFPTQDWVNYFSKRGVSPTLLYEQSKSVVMFCGTGSHWRGGVVGPVTWWSSNSGGTPAGFDAKQDSGDWTHQYVQGIHNGSDNYLFMDGHVENLATTNPNINYYMYNRIPVNGNPWL